MDREKGLPGCCFIATGMVEREEADMGVAKSLTGPGGPFQCPRVCAVSFPSWLPGETELVRFPSFPIPLVP